MLLGGSLTVAVAAPAQAAVDPDVAVRITGVSPTELRDGATVTLTGTITNRGKERWTKAQAYLVIARTPFTTRQQVSDAVESQASYTGERVVELDSIDEVGTLAPGSTRPFRVRVPYAQLRVSDAEGVYPVGVQVLATAEDGTRDNAAIARATTFLPRLDRDSTRVPGGLVWPFVLPDRLGPSGTWMDAPGLAERVAPGGQLRNLLDQALSAPSGGTSLVLDPALLVAVDDLAEGRRLPRDVRLDDAQREAARTFVEDLTGLSRRVATWTLGYARPDWLALSRSDAHDRLMGTIERATSSALAQFQVSGRRVTWPTRGGTTAELIDQVRGSGDRPVIVTRDAVPDWEPRLGSVVTLRSESGPVPLFVDAGLDVGVPGGATVATLRQRLLSEAALASLERSGDAESKADAFVLVDPRWNPGDTDDDAFAGAFDPDFVSPEDLERLDPDGDIDRLGEDAAKLYLTHAEREGWSTPEEVRVEVEVDPALRPGWVPPARGSRTGASVRRPLESSARPERQPVVPDWDVVADLTPTASTAPAAPTPLPARTDVPAAQETMAFPVLVPADATPTVAGARDLFLHRGAHSVRVPRDGVTVLGRLPESPLPLEEPEISYRHAELRLLGGSWQVRDAGSTNGTSVDGERIGDTWVTVRDGAVLALAGIKVAVGSDTHGTVAVSGVSRRP